MRPNKTLWSKVRSIKRFEEYPRDLEPPQHLSPRFIRSTASLREKRAGETTCDIANQKLDSTQRNTGRRIVRSVAISSTHKRARRSPRNTTSISPALLDGEKLGHCPNFEKSFERSQSRDRKSPINPFFRSLAPLGAKIRLFASQYPQGMTKLEIQILNLKYYKKTSKAIYWALS